MILLESKYTGIFEEVINHRYTRLIRPYSFYNKYIDRLETIPKNFIYDKESKPLLRGTCPVGGLKHDFLSRSDASPDTTKHIAAKIYYDEMINAGNGLIKRSIKYFIVRIWPNYFHKFSVSATFEEIMEARRRPKDRPRD